MCSRLPTSVASMLYHQSYYGKTKQKACCQSSYNNAWLCTVFIPPWREPACRWAQRPPARPRPWQSPITAWQTAYQWTPRRLLWWRRLSPSNKKQTHITYHTQRSEKNYILLRLRKYKKAISGCYALVCDDVPADIILPFGKPNRWKKILHRRWWCETCCTCKKTPHGRTITNRFEWEPLRGEIEKILLIKHI